MQPLAHLHDQSFCIATPITGRSTELGPVFPGVEGKGERDEREECGFFHDGK